MFMTSQGYLSLIPTSQVKPERISKEKSQNVAEELARAAAGEGLGAKGVPRGCQGGAKGVPRGCQGGAKASKALATKKGNDDESDPHIIYIIYTYTDTLYIS